MQKLKQFKYNKFEDIPLLLLEGKKIYNLGIQGSIGTQFSINSRDFISIGSTGFYDVEFKEPIYINLKFNKENFNKIIIDILYEEEV